MVLSFLLHLNLSMLHVGRISYHAVVFLVVVVGHSLPPLLQWPCGQQYPRFQGHSADPVLVALAGVLSLTGGQHSCRMYVQPQPNNSSFHLSHRATLV